MGLITSKKYPDVDKKTGEPVSDFFKLTFQTPDGPKTKFLTTTKRVPFPPAKDCAALEDAMGVPACRVERGLYFFKTDPKGDQWTTLTDSGPIHYEDITDWYWGAFRDEVYPPVYAQDIDGEVIYDLIGPDGNKLKLHAGEQVPKGSKKVARIDEVTDPFKGKRPVVEEGKDAEIERLKAQVAQLTAAKGALTDEINWLQTTGRNK